MKACKIKFSLELLLQQLGLDNTDKLEVYKTDIDSYGNIILYLTGEHPDLPIVNEGCMIPDATIRCARVESHIISHLNKN